MNYYILNSKNEIALFDTNKKRLQDTLLFKPELADAKIKPTTKEIVELEGRYVFADEHTDELLEKAKAEKLSELTNICHNFDDQLVNNDMYVISSLGFKINADIRSQNNLKGLISVNADTVNFIDYNNEIHKLTQKDLNTLLIECSKNGENLYTQKWAYKTQIENAQTIEELNAIDFNFVMLDFSEVTDELPA